METRFSISISINIFNLFFPLQFYGMCVCASNGWIRTRTGTKITRSYTPVPKPYAPISCNSETDPNFYLYLLIKTYVNGALTSYITNNPRLATDLEVSHAKGSFKLNELQKYIRIGILAAGSGITPMFEIIDYLMERRSNKM